MFTLVHQRPHSLHSTFHNSIQCDLFLLKVNFPGGNARYFQQVIDQMCQLPHLTLNDCAGFLLEFALVLLETQKLHGADDGGQWVDFHQLIFDHQNAAISDSVPAVDVIVRTTAQCPDREVQPEGRQGLEKKRGSARKAGLFGDMFRSLPLQVLAEMEPDSRKLRLSLYFSAELRQSRTFVHGHVIGLVALDQVLRFLLRGRI